MTADLVRHRLPCRATKVAIARSSNRSTKSRSDLELRPIRQRDRSTKKVKYSFDISSVKCLEIDVHVG